MKKAYANLTDAWAGLQNGDQRWRNWVPSFRWHGLGNRYHRWLSNILLEGDFGRSYDRSQRSVAELLEQSWGITVKLSLVVFVLIYLLAIRLGVWMARHA